MTALSNLRLFIRFLKTEVVKIAEDKQTVINDVGGTSFQADWRKRWFEGMRIFFIMHRKKNRQCKIMNLSDFKIDMYFNLGEHPPHPIPTSHSHPLSYPRPSHLHANFLGTRAFEFGCLMQV